MNHSTQEQAKVFGKWLHEQLFEYQRELGRRVSISEFAAYLEVGQPSCSQWLLGRYLPDDDNLAKIASRRGFEAYDAAGKPRPDARLIEMQDLFAALDEAGRDEFLQAFRDKLAALGFRRQ